MRDFKSVKINKELKDKYINKIRDIDIKTSTYDEQA